MGDECERSSKPDQLRSLSLKWKQVAKECAIKFAFGCNQATTLFVSTSSADIGRLGLAREWPRFLARYITEESGIDEPAAGIRAMSPSA